MKTGSAAVRSGARRSGEAGRTCDLPRGRPPGGQLRQRASARCFVLPLACLLAAAAGAFAAPARAQERLSLPESVSIAIRDNPELDAARHQRNAALAEANRSKPRIQPDVEVTAGHVRRGPV